MPSKSFAIRINKSLSKKDVKLQLKELETQIQSYLDQPDNFLQINLEFSNSKAEQLLSAFEHDKDLYNTSKIEEFIEKLIFIGLEAFKRY